MSYFVINEKKLIRKTPKHDENALNSHPIDLKHKWKIILK